MYQNIHTQAHIQNAFSWTNSDGDFDLSQLIKQQIRTTNNELNLTHVSWKVLNDNVVLCIYGR